MDCRPPGSSVPGKNFPGKNTGMGYHPFSIFGSFSSTKIPWKICSKYLIEVHLLELSSPWILQYPSPERWPPKEWHFSDRSSVFYPAWVKIKTKNQTLSLCQIRYHQHSSEGTMQNKFLNKSMFIMQSETKCNQEGAWLYFKRKCTQEWVWNQKQLWYLLDCDPQPLLPKHTEWNGLVPCVLGCRPNFLTQGRWTGPTTPVLSGQSWVALLSPWG